MVAFRMFILGCLAVMPLSAQADDRLVLKSNPFNEILRDTAEISGVVVVGTQRHGSRQPEQNELQLSSNLPAGWAGGTICTRVRSGDGLYEASNEYDIPSDWAGGNAVLPFPSAYQDLLATLEPNDLAVSISNGECASSPGETAIAIWNEATATTELSLLVNSFRADEVFVYLGDDPKAIRCEAMNDRAMSSFDSVCALPLEQNGMVAVTLYRISNGKPAKPSITQLWFGDGG
ncbi:hypothetical protein ABMC89_04450 [Sulfitobacter sp. HNIBRBA3233]|uniref:hypothetical protein n=1 Tax=Sulfitobacter marinivivus TaxID=3158558 RepID=UPI0032E04244